MPLTLEQAKQLKPGDVLLNVHNKRWRVNGQVKRWKRSPDRIRIPLKHGLYAYDFIDESDFNNGVCEYLTKEA
jgi:hypothetical protein